MGRQSSGNSNILHISFFHVCFLRISLPLLTVGAVVQWSSSLISVQEARVQFPPGDVIHLASECTFARANPCHVRGIGWTENQEPCPWLCWNRFSNPLSCTREDCASLLPLWFRLDYAMEKLSVSVSQAGRSINHRVNGSNETTPRPLNKEPGILWKEKPVIIWKIMSWALWFSAIH